MSGPGKLSRPARRTGNGRTRTLTVRSAAAGGTSSRPGASGPVHALYNVCHAPKEPLGAMFTTTTANSLAKDELEFGCAACSTRGVISVRTVLASESEWPVVG